MKKNRYRDVIAAGKVPVGHMVWEFGTRGIAKLVEAADVDFVIFDMEHSGFGVDRVFDLIAYSKACSFAPFVRVPEGQYHFLARIMDAGALGVMVGNVQTADQAKSIVDATKYAPLGKRGVGLGSAHTDYLVPDPVTYYREINESSVVICQIESPEGVRNAEAIAATPGVDILWIGHYDLSTSMGIPGQFQHPDFLAALRTTVAAARKHGCRLGIQPGSAEQAKEWIAHGFDVLSYGADSAVYRAALTAGVNQLRALV
jgi:2-dehydro-3-deoxyglucarate aldolase/4-hydroxy-2-oxoheptanedioate aldolase